MLLHGFAQGQRGVDVVAVIGQRLGDAFAHGLIPGEVNDRVKIVLSKHLVQRRGVADIRFMAAYRAAGDGFQALEHLVAGVVEIVDNDGFMAGVGQLHIGMRADVPRAARQKDFHAVPSLAD